MGLKRELRSKKLGFQNRMSKNHDNESQETIKKVLDQHDQTQEHLRRHIKNETKSQEEQFNLKMEQRRERSVSRSMSRSMDKGKRKDDANLQSTSNLLSALKINGKGPIQNPFES